VTRWRAGWGTGEIRASFALQATTESLLDANGTAVVEGAPARIAVPTPDGRAEIDGRWDRSGDSWCFTSNDITRPTVLCATADGLDGRVVGTAGNYRVRSAESGGAVITRHDAADALPEADGADAGASMPFAATSATSRGAPYSTDPHHAPCASDTRIDIQMVFTAGAAFLEAGGASTTAQIRKIEGVAQRIIAESNLFMDNSGVNVELVLVDVRVDPFLSPTGANGGDLISMDIMWDCIKGSNLIPCDQTNAYALMDARAASVGADLVVVVTDGLDPNNANDPWAGVASQLFAFADDDTCSVPQWVPTTPGGQPVALSTVQWQDIKFSLTHEIGHTLGAGHAETDNYFGYNLAYDSPDCVFQTIMSKRSRTNHPLPGCDNVSADAQRLPLFSSSCVWAGSQNQAAILGTYGGGYQPTGVENVRDNARILNLSAPYVANHRSQQHSDMEPWRAALISPANGSTVSGTVTFQIVDNQPGLTNQYRLSVGPGNAPPTVYTFSDPTTAVTVPALSTDRRYVRLETKVRGVANGEADRWLYRDYRLNVVDIVRDCSAEALFDALPRDFELVSCGGACVRTGATLTCTTNDGSYASNSGEKPWMVLLSDQGSDDFDHLAYGFREVAGQEKAAPFCCVYRDWSSDITLIEVEGSQRGDGVFLSGCAGDRLGWTTGEDLHVDVRGYAGPDMIVGSSDDRFGLYSESMFGQTGNDTLSGRAGADDLSGGPDADVLYGGAGADRLQGGLGNDSLFGEAGGDALCDDYGWVAEAGDGGDRIFVAAGFADHGPGIDTCADNGTTLGCEVLISPQHPDWTLDCLPY
jgi:hypothetical protein